MSADPLPAFVSISDPQGVDLSRHALIEASAGTGKTYTIENLVVRLLIEQPDIQLENILLVTFTEKATGELKQRIRQKIEQTLDVDPMLTEDGRTKLHACLDGFDNAAIFTIHGFCHTLLREFPFETGNLFQQELIDDGPLFETLLREQIRSDWPRRYGNRLNELLTLSNFSADPDGFVASVVHLAQRMRGDAARETMIPDPGGMDVDGLWRATLAAVMDLKALVGIPPCFSDAYRRLNINAATKKAILRDLIIPLEQTLAQMDDETRPLSPILALMRNLIPRSALRETPLDRLIPQKWLKAGENLHECPYLNRIKRRLDELVRLTVSLSHVLTLTALDQLRSDSRTVKDRSGWISYQDMLTRVADFLGAEGSEAGIQKIRTRYRVAFVDEFQDTDDLQWRIFSTLFMPADSANRLFLIGDPKQAIYGFRGADVFTYLDARQRLGRLAAEKQANLYSLNINWRSTPAMVDGFNQVFAQEAWFGGQEGKGPFEIGYPAADSPAAAQLPLKISSDGSRRPPFNVVDLSAAGSQGQAKEWLAGFICREIRFIVAQARIRLMGENGIDRPLNFGDIAILVRSQGEFHTLAPQLDAWSIPYAYYRQPGLFQCPQAHWLSMVLNAVLNPQHAPTVKLALLTPFFDMDPASLEAWPELPADHISQRLLARWQVEAQKRRWGLLFQSLVEESGMTVRHCTDSGWERSETNFQQLFDYLEITAYARNMDAGGLVAHLDSLRLTGSASGADADIHQIEDEGDKVQILTMHVSKGLEFPVVFIAGGLTMRPAGGLQIYHTMDPERPADGCRKVFDLTGITGREQAQQEFQDENKRLYYVALTRARAKVYVPFYPDDRNHGWIGPICQFVSRSIAEVFGPDGADRLPGGWHTVVEQTTAAPDAKGDISEKRPSSVALPIDGLLPSQADFRHRKIALESFSSIGHRMVRGVVRSGRAEVFSLIDEMRRDDDEPAAGLVVETSSAHPSDELPGGTEMGSMFHYIFETIDFKAVMDGPADLLDDPQLRRVMEMAVERFRIDARWVPAIGRIVAHALRCPITVNGRPLCLGRLSPDQRRHEIEFYFPLAGPLTNPLNKNAGHLSGGPCREMVVRGFIDLVFTWQDCFYIADWKSNRLAQGYHQDAMAREMKAAGYDLQYQLYSLSTLRWLRQRLGGRFDPQHHFGGVYYLFIRGMGGKADEGAFHVPAQQLLPMEALEETIIKRIADIPW